jgi:hypothetical protein
MRPALQGTVVSSDSPAAETLDPARFDDYIPIRKKRTMQEQNGESGAGKILCGAL